MLVSHAISYVRILFSRNCRMCAVIMAFCQPDMMFTPGSFAGTGFQYLDENYNTVKQQIANLKQKGTHALLSFS